LGGKFIPKPKPCTLKYANIGSEIEVIGMPGKKKRVEKAAERTGEAVEKDLKKGAKAVSDFGKGIKKKIKKE
jgi:hypothetical protein